MQEEGSPCSGISELADAEQGLNNYYANIIELIIKSANSESSDMSELSILEFGAGTGFLSQLLQESLGVKVECLEIDETLLQILTDKGFRTYSSLGMVDKTFDLVFSSNVLEHIKNDVEILIELRSLLNPHGKLVTYVPAFPILFSDLDRAVGHYRRYTKSDLEQKLNLAGYEVNNIQYVDSLGFPASLLLRLVGYKSRGNIGGLRSLKIYDQIFFPISRLLDCLGFKRIIGKNIIAHASVRK